MRRLLICLLLFSAFSISSGAAEVYFSPKGGAEDALVHEIGLAKHSIRAAAYQFTNARIYNALVSAQKRGVDIKLVVDKSQAKAGLACCAEKAAPVFRVVVDSKHPIMHDKFMVIDSTVVVTGSFNYSNAAEKSNAENLVVIRDSALATKYSANWAMHNEHSEVFK